MEPAVLETPETGSQTDDKRVLAMHRAMDAEDVGHGSLEITYGSSVVSVTWAQARNQG
jgi:hypothetical protein